MIHAISSRRLVILASAAGLAAACAFAQPDGRGATGTTGASGGGRRNDEKKQGTTGRDGDAGGLAINQVNLDRSAATVDLVENAITTPTKLRYSIGDSGNAANIATVAEVPDVDWDLVASPDELSYIQSYTSPTGTMPTSIQTIRRIEIDGMRLSISDGVRTRTFTLADSEQPKRFATIISAARNLPASGVGQARINDSTGSAMLSVIVELTDSSTDGCKCP